MSRLLCQEFAWTEEELLPKIKARASSMPEAHREQIMTEPMFIFESAIKLYYFAHLMCVSCCLCLPCMHASCLAATLASMLLMWSWSCSCSCSAGLPSQALPGSCTALVTTGLSLYAKELTAAARAAGTATRRCAPVVTLEQQGCVCSCLALNADPCCQRTADLQIWALLTCNWPRHLHCASLAACTAFSWLKSPGCR